MEKKRLDNIADFFPGKVSGAFVSPEMKWDEIFNNWIMRVNQENLMPTLFELKLWFESNEVLLSSSYLENMVFHYKAEEARNYQPYLTIFSLVLGRISLLLKELDLKKDKYFLNFEEYIVDRILDEYALTSFSNLRALCASESWFSGFQVYAANMKVICNDLLKQETLSKKAFTALKKLYHRELVGNPIIISLLNKQFIPEMDKIYQAHISQIIASTADKNLKKSLGIFFVLAFKILKINNFIEYHLSKSKYFDLTLPLVLVLKKHLESLQNFMAGPLPEAIREHDAEKSDPAPVLSGAETLQLELQKIFHGELLAYFKEETSKIRRRKIIRNVIIMTELCIQEVIETVVRIFMPDITGATIFEKYISRKEREQAVKEKLLLLHRRIEDYFKQEKSASPAEVFLEINQFVDSDLNFMLYKDWNEFMNFYHSLNRCGFSSDFPPHLRLFFHFLNRLLKDMGIEKS